MAPIPIRLPEEALSLISSAERRYRHLNELEVPDLRKCTGLLAQQTLAEGVREGVMLLTQQIQVDLVIFHCLSFAHHLGGRQDLEMLVDDLQGEKNRRELRRIVDDFKEKLER